MEKFLDMHKKAEQELKNADHMLYISLDLIQSNKVVAQILEHVSNAAFNALEALLVFERDKHRIKAFPNNVQLMIKIYREQVQESTNLDSKFLECLKSLFSWNNHIKESSINFREGEEFIFSTEEHRSKSISKDRVKDLYNLTEEFVNKVGDIVYG